MGIHSVIPYEGSTAHPMKVSLSCTANEGSRPPAALAIILMLVSLEASMPSGLEARMAWCMVGAA